MSFAKCLFPTVNNTLLVEIRVYVQYLQSYTHTPATKHKSSLTQIVFVTVTDTAFSALTLLVGRQEGHPACKKLSGGLLAWLSVCSEVQTCIWPS